MEYINFLQDDNAIDQAYIKFENIESTFEQDDILQQLENLKEDESKPLNILGKQYYTIKKDPWYLITKQGGCRIIQKENIIIIATYDENKQQNASKFRRRMSLLNQII